MTLGIAFTTTLLLVLQPFAQAQIYVWTTSPDSVTSTSAVFRGSVRSQSGEVEVRFLYGIQWPNQHSTTAGTLIGGDVIEVRLRIENLVPNTLYAYKMQALQVGMSDSNVTGGIVLFRTLEDSSHGGFLSHLRFFGAGGSTFLQERSFGIETRATFCQDFRLGELGMPPEPPQGAPDFRFISPRGLNTACMDLGLSLDMRPFLHAAQVDTYRVRFSPGLPGYPMVVSWNDIAEHYNGQVRLVDAITGSFINVDMKSQNSVMIPEPISEIVILAEAPIDPTLVASIHPAYLNSYDLYLAQNYPNPFNPTTTIGYEIPRPGFVSLVVFDILGREVSILVHEEKSPGRYKVRWSAGGLASGVYLYRLQSGGSNQTKVLILSR